MVFAGSGLSLRLFLCGRRYFAVGHLYAIHPEFENAEGGVQLDSEASVREKGTARMWVLFPAMRREVHARRITVGTKGFFMEGPRRVAAVEVIEVNGLSENAKNVID